jgi:hypothetical protein
MKKKVELIRQDPKIIEQQIIDFMVSLQGWSRATKSLRMAAVVALYSINDITLNRKRLSKFLGPKTNEDKTTNDVF